MLFAAAEGAAAALRLDGQAVRVGEAEAALVVQAGAARAKAAKQKQKRAP